MMFDVFVVCVREIFSLLSSQTFSLFRLKKNIEKIVRIFFGKAQSIHFHKMIRLLAGNLLNLTLILKTTTL